MAVYPLYSVVQSVLMPPIGLVWYLWLLVKSRNAGRYRFGFRGRNVIERLGFLACGDAECNFCRTIIELDVQPVAWVA